MSFLAATDEVSVLAAYYREVHPPVQDRASVAAGSGQRAAQDLASPAGALAGHRVKHGQSPCTELDDESFFARSFLLPAGDNR
ncbi:hypothetical protein [Micromonospora sp. NPDC050200]|uniref:hypothetical protein n=1 Tax=Micromonospora sp. NPDC050200 TaxID=3155664 RepID=UPI0033D2E5A6